MPDLVLVFAVALWLLAPGATQAGSEFLKDGKFEGRESLVLSNDRLDVTLLKHGGAFASLVLRDDPARLNPLWDPIRMARESGAKPPSGSGVGHFVCVDGFGPASAQERAAGLPGHGEAQAQPWELVSSGKSAGVSTARFLVRLPLVQETLTRTVRMADGENVVYVSSELENLLAFDRPVCWAEHATIGSPFLEPGKTVVDMSARLGKTRTHEGRRALPMRLASFQDFTWPLAPGLDGRLIDLRAAPPSPNSLDHTTCLMDPTRRLVFVTALHPDRRLLLGYLFKREEFPWLQTWEHYPPDLRMARGLEFGTLPFDVPRREAFDTHSLFGTPTYRWLPAKSKIGSSFVFFYTRTPAAFTRVDDVKLENGTVVVEDRGAGLRIVLPASLAW